MTTLQAKALERVRLGVRRFASGALPRPERIPAWERHNATSLVALQAESDPGQEFMAAGMNLRLPELDIARVRCTPHRVQRTDEDITEHPVGGVVGYLNLDRRGTFWHRGQCIELEPGQLLIVDGDQGFSREFARGTDEYVFRISRDLLSESVQHRNLATPQVFGADSPAWARELVADLRHLAATALRSQRQDWEGLQERTAQLLAGLLGQEQQSPLFAAQQIIGHRHADPRFGAPELAAALGVSTRQLSRIFAAEGRSVAHELRAARLATGHTMLADPRFAHLAVADIALRAGFVSPAHFTRSYRSHYGQSPLRHRRDLLQVPLAS